MSAEDTITLKEFIQMNVSELKTSIKDVHDTSQKGAEIGQKALEQATKTNGRVNTLEETVDKVTAIIERHDNLLVMDEGRTKQRDILWKIAMWGMPFLLAGLGYFGFLYIEHIKYEVIAQTSDQVITLIEKNYSPNVK